MFNFLSPYSLDCYKPGNKLLFFFDGYCDHCLCWSLLWLWSVPILLSSEFFFSKPDTHLILLPMWVSCVAICLVGFWFGWLHKLLLYLALSLHLYWLVHLDTLLDLWFYRYTGIGPLVYAKLKLMGWWKLEISIWKDKKKIIKLIKVPRWK
jgi:hypothetical protein